MHVQVLLKTVGIEKNIKKQLKKLDDKSQFLAITGKCASFCYLPSDVKTLVKESNEASINRAIRTLGMGHQSVAEHCWVTLTVEDAPKILAMILNNFGYYAMSEKSARYKPISLDKIAYDETNHEIILEQLSKQDCELYLKWLNIFKTEIAKKYGDKYPKWFTEDVTKTDNKGNTKTVAGKITKLAQENARYLISIFMPTSFVYSVPFRQLNYIYNYIKYEVENPSNIIYEKLKNVFLDFLNQLEKTNLIDKQLFDDGKNRHLTLIGNGYKPKEYFGDVYVSTYKASFATYGQLQRHRTIDYYFNIPKKVEFYVPKILRNNFKLKQEWLQDCEKQKNKFPQAMLLDVVEMGNLDNFILKLKERLCSCAQLEINDVTHDTLNKYFKNLEQSKHPRLKELKSYTKGSRCLNNYNCKSPCGFTEGITNNNRLI